MNKSYLSLALFFFLFGLTLFTLSKIITNDNWFIHQIFCILNTFIILFFFLKLYCKYNKLDLILLDARCIVLLAFLVYNIFGPSILVFGSDEQIDNEQNLYFVSADLALKINSMNLIGLSIAFFLSSTIKLSWAIKLITFLTKPNKYLKFSTPKSIIAVTIFFIILQIYSVKINLTIINQPIFGSVFSSWFIFITAGSIFMLILHESNKFYFLIFSIFLLCLNIICGLLLFNKTVIVASILSFSFAYALRKNSIKIIILVFPLIFFLFSFIGNLSQNYAQTYATQKYENKNIIDILLYRKDIVLNKTNYVLIDEVENYNTWSRFNLMNTQGAAIDFYDKGNGSELYKEALWFLIPRILNKEKPNLSLSDKELFEKITNTVGSHKSAGIFLDGYYNLGWTGVVISSTIFGFFILIASIIIKIIYFQRIYVLFFFLFFILLSLTNIDKNFLYYFSSIIYIIFFFAGLYLIKIFLKIHKFLLKFYT
jgi:hypothetical protein